MTVTIYDVQPGRRTGTTSPIACSNGCSSSRHWPMDGELMKIINTERRPTVTFEQRICILIKYPKSHINHIRTEHRVLQVDVIGRLQLNGFTNFPSISTTEQFSAPNRHRSDKFRCIHLSLLIFGGGQLLRLHRIVIVTTFQRISNQRKKLLQYIHDSME